MLHFLYILIQIQPTCYYSVTKTILEQELMINGYHMNVYYHHGNHKNGTSWLFPNIIQPICFMSQNVDFPNHFFGKFPLILPW